MMCKGRPIEGGLFRGPQRPDCPAEESEELQRLLEGAGGRVTVHWENSGHQLTATEVAAAGQWYQNHFGTDGAD